MDFTEKLINTVVSYQCKFSTERNSRQSFIRKGDWNAKHCAVSSVFLEDLEQYFHLQRQNELDFEWEGDGVLINKEKSGALDELKTDRGTPVKCLKKQEFFYLKC